MVMMCRCLAEAEVNSLTLTRFIQRLSVYIQKSEEKPRNPSEPAIPSPQLEPERRKAPQSKLNGPLSENMTDHTQSLRSLDNGTLVTE